MNKRIFRLTIFTIAFLLMANVSFAANYYWVGAAGNWGDLSHWATTSGGTTKHASVPGSADNVIFDANSGFGTTTATRTVTINVTALAANFSVSGLTNTPIFSSTNTPINVYGDMTLQTGTLLNAPVSFKPVSAQTLRTNGVAFNHNASVDGAGSLRLLDNLTINDAYSLTFVSGTFDTDNKQLNVGNLVASGNAVKTIILGSSQVYIAVSARFHGGTNVNIQAGTSHLHFTGSINVNATTTNGGLTAANALSLYDVTFENPNSAKAGIHPSTSSAGTFTFHNLTFKGNGTLQKNAHTVANLYLVTSKFLELPASNTLTITESLNLGTAGDACASYNSINSNDIGTAANIKMMTGAVANVYHSVIRDISVVRDGNTTEVFDAQLNSYDGGGNTRWNFVAATPVTFYWIGGAGNWSDPRHWSLSSGGASAGCIPSVNDHAVFNNASGFTAPAQVINVDVAARCNNISFLGTSNAPKVSENALTVTGSAIWQNGMILATTLTYAPKGTQSITSNGVKHVNTTIAGRVATTDKLTLVDAFESSGSVYFTGGTFNTNNQTVTLANFYSGVTTVSSNLARRLELTSSHVYVKDGYFDTNDGPVAVVGGTSVIHFNKILLINEGFSAFNGQQYYDLIFEAAGTTTTGAGMKVSGTATVYHDVTFRGNGMLRSGRYNSLTLTQGKTYDVVGGHTLTINGSLNAMSMSCNQPITIASTTTGNYTFSMPATATVNVQGVVISNSTATGGANFIANNSTNIANNTGWVFPANSARTLYWVGGLGDWTDAAHWSLTSGGTGGECMPSNVDDVFFDANSGFTAASKTVSFPAADTYVHNLTIAGTVAAPIFSGSTTLNIYGSTVLQNGISWNILTVFRPAAGNTETLTSNGGRLGSGSKRTSIEGAGTLKLLDDAIFNDEINFLRGTFDTDGKSLTATRLFDWYSSASTTSTVRTLKLGSSTVNITGSNSNWDFMMIVPGSKIDAGTSRINFNGVYTNGMGAITVTPNTILYDVYFNNAGSSTAGLSYGYSNNAYAYPGGDNLKFNSMTFSGGGYINSTGNTFGTLVLSAGKTYQFKAGAEQIITSKLYASGNPCQTITLKSITSGSQTKLNVQGGSTNFDYGILTDINAAGSPLTYGINSSNGGNNTNVIFDTNGTPGTIAGLGANWLCHLIDAAVPTSYTINTDGFYADPSTTYSWTKTGSATVIGTGPTLDISTLGYGTYKVVVTYALGCTVSDDIVVQQGTVKPTANATQKFCATVSTSLAKVIISGTNVKWYIDATSTAVLPLSTLLVSGHTYYATQTVNNACESARLPVAVFLENCAVANPALRNRGAKE